MPVGISRFKESTAVKEPKVRVRPSVLMAGVSPGESDSFAVRVAMPPRLDPGGFTAASLRRHSVSRRFVPSTDHAR